MQFKGIGKILNIAIVIATLAAALWILFIYADANMQHYNAHMEADIASETLLADVLHENGHVQPDTWQMSTARRIIAAPMLASFLYPVAGNNMVPAMGLACTLMILMLIAAMIFFNRQIGLGLRESLVAVLIMLMLSAPSDEAQRMLFLYASYYVGHFISMFIVLGLYARTLKRGRLSVLTVVITIPLAVINGIQGSHASMFFYLPMLGAEILRRLVLLIKKKKSSFAISIWVAVVAVVSYVCSKIFEFGVTGVSRNIRHAPEKFFGEVLPAFKVVLFYGRLEFVVIILIIAAVAGYMLAVKELSKTTELWATLPIVFGVIVVLLSATFTTAEVAPRYFIMQIFVLACGVPLLMKLFSRKMAPLLALIVIIYAVNSAMAFDDGLIKSDHSAGSEYVKVAQFMEEFGYEYGYSTFDHANPITVMSYGKAKVRAVNSFDEMQGLKWLTDSSWYPPTKNADSPTCYVVSRARQEEFDRFVERENPKIIDSKEFDTFVVYVTDKDYTYWVD